MNECSNLVASFTIVSGPHVTGPVPGSGREGKGAGRRGSS